MSNEPQTASSTQQRIADYCDHLKRTLQAKNRDYGDSAFQSPLLSPSLSPLSAILTRMSDKVHRISQLVSSNEGPQVRNEGLEDSILDLAGYCILYLIAVGHPLDNPSQHSLGNQVADACAELDAGLGLTDKTDSSKQRIADAHRVEASDYENMLLRKSDLTLHSIVDERNQYVILAFRLEAMK